MWQDRLHAILLRPLGAAVGPARADRRRGDGGAGAWNAAFAPDSLYDAWSRLTEQGEALGPAVAERLAANCHSLAHALLAATSVECPDCSTTVEFAADEPSTAILAAA